MLCPTTQDDYSSKQQLHFVKEGTPLSKVQYNKVVHNCLTAAVNRGYFQLLYQLKTPV